MKFIIKITTILSVLTLLSSISAAKIYKWVDDAGRVHFSDVKPKDVSNVEEPYNKLKNVKTNASPADIERYYPGTWKLDKTQTIDGQSMQVVGTMTYARNGVITSDLTALVSNNNPEKADTYAPFTVRGSWYQSDNTEITTTLVTTFDEKVTTKTQTQAIIEITSEFMKTMNDEGDKETLYREVIEGSLVK
jgi:hypothetical protein